MPVRLRPSAGWVAVAFLLALPGSASAADYAPLDCASAATPAERTVCGHYGLGQKEARLATLFEVTTAFVGMGERGAIQDAQRAFLAKREECATAVPCITQAYDRRIGELDVVLTRIKKAGPF